MNSSIKFPVLHVLEVVAAVLFAQADVHHVDLAADVEVTHGADLYVSDISRLGTVNDSKDQWYKELQITH